MISPPPRCQPPSSALRGVSTDEHASRNLVNLIKQTQAKASIKTRRKTLGWDDQYLHDARIQKWA